MSLENKKLELITFFTLLAGLSILIFFVFKPFLYIIILAAVLSVLSFTTYKKIVKLFGGHKSLAACAMLLIVLIFLVIPILFFGSEILGQIHSFYSLTQADQGQYLDTVQTNINTFVQGVIPNFSFSISDSINKIMVFLAENLGGLLSQTTYIIFQTFFLLFTFFFFLRDGDKILESFLSFSPFEKSENKEIVDSVYKTITSVMHGTLLVGLIRFVLICAVFYILGIPNALLWASIGGLIGLIPGLGTPFVIIPALLYFLFYGNTISALLMGMFGIFISVFVDNMLAAHYFGKGLDVPPLFVLFSILGGIIFFGPLGFIFGPIALSLFVSTVDIYKKLILRKP